MTKEFKIICIKDDFDNPLRLEFTASGFEPSKKVGLFINGVLLISIFVDRDGIINQKNIIIPDRALVDFVSLGGFGQKLNHRDSLFRKTSAIAHMVAGNIKLEVRYI